jgi:hypothetical protein
MPPVRAQELPSDLHKLLNCTIAKEDIDKYLANELSFPGTTVGTMLAEADPEILAKNVKTITDMVLGSLSFISLPGFPGPEEIMRTSIHSLLIRQRFMQYPAQGDNALPEPEFLPA